MADFISDLKTQLESTDSRGRAEAVAQLLNSAESVISFCGLFCDRPADRLSSLAHEALKRLGPRAVASLVHVLKAGNPRAQVYAMVGLKMLDEQSALEPVLDALESPHAEVRLEAVNTLWMLRNSAAVEPLIRHLQHDGDAEVKRGAASALGWLGDRRALSPLLVALEDRDWNLRQTAAYALGQLGDEQALPALRRSLSDPKPQVRKSVKSALSRFHFRQQR